MRGSVAIIFTVLILAIIAAMASAVSGVSINEIKFSRNVGDSVIALQLADAGVEYALDVLQRDARGTDLDGYSGSLATGSFQIPGVGLVRSGGSEGAVTKLNSIGIVGDIRRAVELSF